MSLPTKSAFEKRAFAKNIQSMFGKPEEDSSLLRNTGGAVGGVGGTALGAQAGLQGLASQGTRNRFAQGNMSQLIGKAVRNAGGKVPAAAGIGTSAAVFAALLSALGYGTGYGADKAVGAVKRRLD